MLPNCTLLHTVAFLGRREQAASDCYCDASEMCSTFAGAQSQFESTHSHAHSHSQVRKWLKKGSTNHHPLPSREIQPKTLSGEIKGTAVVTISKSTSRGCSRDHN